jgi:hypothetical protein
MTIQQTVEIPADKRLYLQLPRNVPSGRLNLRLIFTPALAETRISEKRPQTRLLRNSPKTVKEAIAEARQKTAERLADPENDSVKKYAGCLNGKNIFNGDPVEIQRRMRDEWD